MSQMEIDRVLSQIRDLRAQASLNRAPLAARQADNSSTVSFASILKQGVDQVNRQQQTAASMAVAFERGAPGVDLPQAKQRGKGVGTNSHVDSGKFQNLMASRHQHSDRIDSSLARGYSNANVIALRTPAFRFAPDQE